MTDRSNKKRLVSSSLAETQFVPKILTRDLNFSGSESDGDGDGDGEGDGGGELRRCGLSGRVAMRTLAEPLPDLQLPTWTEPDVDVEEEESAAALPPTYDFSVQGWMDRLNLTTKHAIPPAEFPNFGAGCPESPMQDVELLSLVDAGVGINLPFPSLMRPEREIDVIICCDHSKWPNIARCSTLLSLEAYAQRTGLKLPPLLYDNVSQRVVNVFIDPVDETVPVIIYMPLVKNERYSEFDPQESVRTGGYCHTFNFNFLPEQVDELSGLTEFNMKEASAVIAEVLKIVYQRKLRKFGSVALH